MYRPIVHPASVVPTGRLAVQSAVVAFGRGRVGTAGVPLQIMPGGRSDTAVEPMVRTAHDPTVTPGATRVIAPSQHPCSRAMGAVIRSKELRDQSWLPVHR